MLIDLYEHWTLLIFVVKVRKATAEQLYTTFLTYDEVLPEHHNDDIMEILTEVSW